MNDPTDTSKTCLVDTGVCGDNITCSLDSEGTLIVSGNGDMFDYKFSSSSFEGLTIKKIIIFEGVRWIGGFARCEYLTQVKAPAISGIS